APVAPSVRACGVLLAGVSASSLRDAGGVWERRLPACPCSCLTPATFSRHTRASSLEACVPILDGRPACPAGPRGVMLGGKSADAVSEEQMVGQPIRFVTFLAQCLQPT